MKKTMARPNELESRSDARDLPLPLTPPPTVKGGKTFLPNDSKLLGYF
ncbi:MULTISPECIES: hypothetical protein [unclassified Bradyrhizobium]|nr:MULTISPECIES: hypothetical protein [unclassified Bradyrhizobium]MBW7966288.1 hypothetical protein [Bradyrhizobium sp. BR 10261]